MARTASANTTAAHARTKRAASQVRQSARESVDDLKSDMSTLKSRIENLATAGSAEGMASVQQMFARMQERFDDFLETDFAEQLGVNAAMDKGREKVDEMRETIQDKPMQSILIAAGVGALVGFLLRR